MAAMPKPTPFGMGKPPQGNPSASASFRRPCAVGFWHAVIPLDENGLRQIRRNAASVASFRKPVFCLQLPIGGPSSGWPKPTGHDGSKGYGVRQIYTVIPCGKGICDSYRVITCCADECRLLTNFRFGPTRRRTFLRARLGECTTSGAREIQPAQVPGRARRPSQEAKPI
jgi:hypothetical protein